MSPRRLLLPLVAACTIPVLADPNEHAADDAFWADAAALLPGFDGTPAAPGPSNDDGSWGSVMTWPHTPVSAATLPTGKILTFSGQEPKHWPGTKTQTYWAVWDPASNTFSNDLYLDHEMFCAHLVMRTDGNVQSMGGRYTVRDSSTYDWRENRWSRNKNMFDPRWYTTSVALPDGDVFTVSGSGGPNTAERYHPETDIWQRLGGINWQPVAQAEGFESDWWPYVFVAPDGRLFHFGPTKEMHWVSPDGNGTRVSAGLQVPGNYYSKHAGVVMYASGKFLVAGGASSATDSNTSSTTCYTVDLNTTPPTVALTSPMRYPRRFQNAIVLPTGEVLIVGGNTSGVKFSDQGTILTPEIWNPATGTWREVADMAIPRNYHSTALLLPDGRVFSGGGGYESGNPNSSITHTDAQLYTPPSLFDSNGSAATRPVIGSAPDSVTLGSVFAVDATAGLHRFSMIRLMATTHGLSTDQRFLDIPFSEEADGHYRLVAHPNANVMVPGYWMLFGLDENGVYSKAKILHVRETIDAPTSGLQATYHDGTALANPKLTRTDAVVDFDYEAESPLPAELGADNWSTRWTGWVIPDYTETYTFSTTSDDGVRLWVDGQKLVDDWTAQAATEHTGSIALTAGVPVPIQLEHYQGGGDAIIQLRWSSPRTAKAIIPSRTLRAAQPENEAVIAADNRHEFYVDGHLVAIGTDWKKALRSAFSAGQRATLAIHATDADGIGGVIGDFTIGGHPVITDAGWKVSTSAAAGWEKPGFDDSGWASATDYGALTASPWNGEVTGMPVDTPARWIWSADREADDEVFLRLMVGMPEFSAISDRVGLIGSTVSFTPTITYSDLGGITFAATGLPAGLSLDPASGTISGTPSEHGVFTVTLTVLADGAIADTAHFTWTIRLPGQGDGSLLREVWYDVSGSTIEALTSDPRYPASPSLSGEITAFPVAANSGDNYGTRLRGYLHAPVSGDYTFWISSDDSSRLLLSTDESAFSAVEIAGITNGKAGVTEWNKFTSQQSAPIPLVGGRRYYLEILHKEGTGSDHINLAWQGPGDAEMGVMEGSFLSPYNPNLPPVLAAIGDLEHTVGGAITFHPRASDPNGDDLTFTTSGLPAGLSLDPENGDITGTPVSPGAMTVTLTVSDSEGATASQSFQWTIHAALALEPPLNGVDWAGATPGFSVQASGGTGVRYVWNFGDDSEEETTTEPVNQHTFATPGRYTITLTGIDANGTETTATFYQNIRPHVSGARPTVSQAIAVGAGSVWTVNPDNGSVSTLNLVTGGINAEIATGEKPHSLAFAPDGSLWVANQSSSTISVIDPATYEVSSTIALPRGSAPFGLAFTPDGSAAFVALEASGQLAKLSPTTREILGLAEVGPHPRHLSITADSATVLVSRFITPLVPGEATGDPSPDQGGGEIVSVSVSDLAIGNTIVLVPSQQPDSGGGGRGIPNYLGPAVISPAGDFAWVPSKQDNIQRGMLRDGKDLTHDSTVRAITSLVNLSTGAEEVEARIDHDDGSVPSTALFDPFGLFLFVALEGSQEVAVIDAYARAELFRIPVGFAPQGLALSPDGSVLFVHNFMSRSVSLVAVADLVNFGLPRANLLATLGTVARDALPADVLKGKQLFYDAKDDRMGLQDYISCAACHNEGGHDGRVWDFTGFGEGLRNTIDLRGRAGTGHGPLHWSANFDEVQDFDNQVRDLAGGDGLIDGLPHPPLGEPNAGRSADLDALAAYVTSLSGFAESPHRQPGGELTPSAQRGRTVFISENCASCHGGVNFTDSGSGPLHDIGTLKPSSGSRLGGVLDGFDTPTLRGLHDGAPYLHDGSAATLAEAVQAHEGVDLAGADLDDLVSYLLQIEDSEAAAPTPGAPAILSFTASPTTIPAGGASTLSWTVVDGGSPLTELKLNGASVLGSTTFTVNPVSTTTYTLAATSSAGTATASLTITIASPPPAGGWSDWVQNYSLSGDPADDHDGDSFSDGIEFSLGMDPTAGDANVSTVAGADPGLLRAPRIEPVIFPDGSRRFDLVFTRPAETPDGVSYWLEGTLDLEDGWGVIAHLNGSGGTDIDPGVLSLEVRDLGDGTEEVHSSLYAFDQGYLRLSVDIAGDTLSSAPFGWLKRPIDRSQKMFAPPFAREAVAGGNFTSADGFSLTDPSAAWTTDQWLDHEVQITSGDAAGALLVITGNTADTLNFGHAHPLLAGRLADAASGNYVIRRSQTLASLFGGLNEDGVIPGTPDGGDLISFDSPAGVFGDYYFRSGGLGGAGWRSTADPFADMAGAVIAPGDGFTFRHSSSDPVTLWFYGEVVLGQRLRIVRQGTRILGSQTPVDHATLDTLGLDPYFLVSPDSNNHSHVYLESPWGYQGHYQKDDTLPGGSGWRAIPDDVTEVGGKAIDPASGWLFFRFGEEAVWERPQPFSYPE
ncbi:PA14 domain-containing protein [Haloferula sargassicola]|uniref:Virginiamycin B lyase n=1 Tax=Haloferula sargassicola TaxID=490096 RepID=A0ABP9UIQ8_9BACT